jgi:transposase
MNPRRYELSDFEWSVIQPLLPNKPRGVPRADDRKVLNGIYWRLRTGSPWADIPERYGPPTTCANRFRRWAKIGGYGTASSRRCRRPMTAICR